MSSRLRTDGLHLRPVRASLSLKKTEAAQVEQLSIGLFVKAAGAFAVFLLIVKGLLLAGESGSREFTFGLAMILLASVALWMTIDHWPKWLFGFCCANVLRCVGMGMIGRTFSYPSMTAPRLFFFELASLLAIMAVELYRFVRISPNFFERVCLIVALVALIQSLISKETFTFVLAAVLLLAPSTIYKALTARETTS